MLSGLDAAERERVAALRGEGRFFWLDVSLRETSPDDLVDALGVPERALRALASSDDASASRMFHADRESLVFALRCYIESEAPAGEAAYRLRPAEIHVLITGDYLLTLHGERISLPAILAPELPQERSKPYVVYAVLEAIRQSQRRTDDYIRTVRAELRQSWRMSHQRRIAPSIPSNCGTRRTTFMVAS